MKKIKIKKQIKLFTMIFLIIIILYADVIFLKVYFQQPQYSPAIEDIPEINEFKENVSKGLLFLIGFVIASIIATIALIITMMRIMGRD